MKNPILCVVFLLVVAAGAHGQQAPLFSQFMFNNLYYNPASAGIEGSTKFYAIHRSQWVGYNPTLDQGGALSTQIVALNTPILLFNSGIGVYILRDQPIPALSNTEAQVSYAYHLSFTGRGKLSLGVKAGFFSQQIDFKQYRPVDPDDPLLLGPKDPEIRPDLSLGAFYRAEKYYVGASINHLLKKQFSFGTNEYRNALSQVAYFNGGYYFNYTSKITFTPTALIQTDFKVMSIQAGLTATFNEKFWIGGAYRQSEGPVFLGGLSLLKDNSLKLGYSLDYVLKAQEAKQATSHEVMLSYTLPVATTNRKSIIRTPRFRQ